MVSQKIHAPLYAIIDFVSAILAWTLFFLYRKYLETESFYDAFTRTWQDTHLYQGLTVIPLAWLLLYSAYGYYRQPFSKSLFTDFSKTLNHSIGGVVGLFFIVILDDYVENYSLYYQYVFVLFAMHFSLTLTGRVCHTYIIRKRIQKGKILFNTLLIGNGNAAQKIYDELLNQKHCDGYKILGYVKCRTEQTVDGLPCLGSMNALERVVKTHQIEEVIIALNNDETAVISDILSNLASCKISIRISPNLEPFLHKKVTSFLHSTLLLLSDDPMPAWQNFLKRCMDILFSFVLGVILLPLILFAVWKVRRSSKGRIFYTQERIGLYEKTFMMYKFRSMYENAETPDNPMLSSENDIRVTPFGRFMRKYRVDELPQLWNVIKGDMSLVGPRPERRYYIDQITQISPQYKLLLRVKPGLTSWGEVKYGYASSVAQMIERMTLDLQYIDNMSLSNDLKILLYTIITVLRGEGK